MGTEQKDPRQELAKSLSAALEEWKSSETRIKGFRKLEGLIEFAIHNGMDLVLNVSESAINRTGGFRPISENAANEFGIKARDESILFIIPSDLSKRREGSGKTPKLIMQDDCVIGPRLLIRNDSGVFGAFASDQVIALEPK